MILEFIFKINKMISTNDTLMPRPRKTKSGRWTAYFAPTQEMKNYKEQMSKILKEIIDDKQIEELKKEFEESKNLLRINLKINWFMPRRDFLDDDTSNYIKPYEDCLVKRIGIDDKYNISVFLRKSIHKFDYWMVKTEISTEFIDLKTAYLCEYENFMCSNCHKISKLKTISHDNEIIVECEKCSTHHKISDNIEY